MISFKPELCVLRKTKPEHYDLKQVRDYAKAYKMNAANIKLKIYSPRLQPWSGPARGTRCLLGRRCWRPLAVTLFC